MRAGRKHMAGLTYDSAGNVTVDSKFRNLAFQYDANNRQKQSSAPDGSGAVVSVYDAGGQRVATQVGGSLTNVLVYDAGGKLVAEYGSAPPQTNGTQYVTSDQQGSPRAITDSSGAIVSRHDYAPFGEELVANVGMRMTGQNYSQPDSVRQKYAGMENDDATGMSHTLWRKFDPLSARWTVPDSYGGSMEIDDPQSFNRYAYVYNDPVNETDPLGLMAGADQSWASVAGDFWGSSAGFNRPNFGGPETIGAALMLNQSRTNDWLSRLRHGGEAGLGGEDVIVTNTFAFHTRAEALRYYEREFGGPVRERNGRFVPSGGSRLPRALEGYGKALVYGPLSLAKTFYENHIPDGLQFSGSAMWVFNVNITLTKDLDVFGGVETPNVTEIVRTGLKNAKSGRITPYGGSAMFVKIAAKTTRRERRAFFSGSAFNVSAGYNGVVGGYIRSGGMHAIGIGAGTPGVNIGSSYSQPIFSRPALPFQF